MYNNFNKTFKTMRKFIISLIAVFAMMFSANAQTTVLGSRTFENTYVSVNGGVLSPFAVNDGFWKDLRPTAGIELGKNITPVVGVSVAVYGAFNTTGLGKFVDQTDLVANFKVNMSNWIGGYKGQPRLVEVSLVPAVGWGHNVKSTEPDKNYITLNPHAQVDFNLGKAKAWQINVNPGVVWRTQSGVESPSKMRTAAQVTVGVTYKFGSRRTKSHNFVTSPYTVAQADYDAALARIAALESRTPEKVEVVKEVPVEKVVEKTVSAYRPYDTFITFKIGSATLTAVEAAKVEVFAKGLGADVPVLVIGSADTATGSAARNQTLATRRAAVVASALRDAGVKDVRTDVKLDAADNDEAARAAVIRIVE